MSLSPALPAVDLHNRSNQRLILASLSLGAIAFALMQSLVVPAMPEIQRATGASETSVSWILTAYLLVASIVTPIIGRLGDIYGKDKVMVYVLGGVAVGVVVTAVMPANMTTIIAGRAIQGIGGGIFPLAFAIIRDEFPQEKVAGGIGFLSSLIGAASGVGIVAAGLIVEKASYEWIFWVPLLAVVPAMVGSYFFVPESPEHAEGKINWGSAALMSIGLATVLITLTEATDWGWTSAKTLIAFAVGLAFIGAWIFNEIRSRTALVDMAMMRIRGVWTTNLVAFLVGIGMYSAFILLPLLVQEPTSTGYGLGASVIGGALFVLPMAVTMLLAGQIVGPIERRVGSRPPLLAGCALTAISFLGLTLAHSTPADIYVFSGIMGLGIGLAYATLPALIVENVEPQQTGVATGMNNVLRTVGGAFGGQIAATILAGKVAADNLPTDGAFTLAFALCAAAVLIGFLAAFLIPTHGASFDAQVVEPHEHEHAIDARPEPVRA
jgi:EmrB/QacA subfamily drug resistance transporter